MATEFNDNLESQSNPRITVTQSEPSVVPQQPCPTCGAVTGDSSRMPAWIYALGQIEPRFPSISVEKELAQATGREQTAGLTNREALHQVLSHGQNRYLARQLCWLMSIEGLETYILRPRDPSDLGLLLDTVRPRPRPTDLDLVIGVRGPIAVAPRQNSQPQRHGSELHVIPGKSIGPAGSKPA